jgi:hypothetical protein
LRCRAGALFCFGISEIAIHAMHYKQRVQHWHQDEDEQQDEDSGPVESLIGSLGRGSASHIKEPVDQRKQAKRSQNRGDLVEHDEVGHDGPFEKFWGSVLYS